MFAAYHFCYGRAALQTLSLYISRAALTLFKENKQQAVMSLALNDLSAYHQRGGHQTKALSYQDKIERRAVGSEQTNLSMATGLYGGITTRRHDISSAALGGHSAWAGGWLNDADADGGTAKAAARGACGCLLARPGAGRTWAFRYGPLISHRQSSRAHVGTCACALSRGGSAVLSAVTTLKPPATWARGVAARARKRSSRRRRGR